MKEDNEFSGINFYNYAKALAILRENLAYSSGIFDEDEEKQASKVRIKVVNAIGVLVNEHFPEEKK